MQDNTVEINHIPQLSTQLVVPPSPRLSKKVLALIIAIVVLLFIGAGVGLFIAYRAGLERDVIQVLNTVPNAMSNVAQDGAAYPQKVPAGVGTNSKITLIGGGSFDGTTYCVTGTSTVDGSIVYHIDSRTKKSIKGACPTVQSTSAPGAVSGLAIASIGSSDFGLTWQAVEGATGYTLQCSIDSTFSGKVIETVSATTQGVCSNLESQTKYYVRVQAKNQTTAGPWSDAVSGATTLLSSAPENLTLKPVSSTQISYSWSPAAGATSYIVERASDTSFLKDIVSVTQTATSGSSIGLTPGTTYYYHVKAVTANFDAEHAAFSNEIGTMTNK